MYSRAEVERQTGKYSAVVPTRIAQWEPALPASDSSDLEDATRQLVEFDTEAQRILGTRHPALGPMTAILLRTESASSSQIEQLTTSAQQLALAEIGESSKANALTVIGNVRAMEAALSLAHDVSKKSILAMHKALMLNQQGFPAEEAGHFRTEQVWIGPGTAGPREADFIAPHHDHIEMALEDLVEFMNRDDVPVLIQVAVSHAQFETIHPFSDGNGRTGRALVQSLLRAKGLISSTALPISSGLLVDVNRYFLALGAYRKGNAGPIIRQFAAASRIAATTGKKLVDDLAHELEKSRQRMKGIRVDATAWEVLAVLIGQPALNVKYLINKLGLNEMTALRALTALERCGVVVEKTGKSRGRVWQHPGIFEVLETYAAHIKRMSVS